MVIDDDEFMVKLLRFVVKKEGYLLTTASDGLEAIKNLPQTQPDLIITDVMLPFRSGLEIINHVRENYKNIPIIVLSSLGEEAHTVTEAFKLGADDFVSKPFNPNELMLRVKRLLVPTESD